MHTPARGRGQTRREFVRRAAGLSSFALFGGSLLAACGGDDEEAAAPAAAGETGTGAGAATATGPLGPVTLNFVGWEGYDGLQAETFPKTIAWMEEQQIEIVSTYVADNDEMLAKIQASSPGAYDLTCPAHLTLPSFIAAGVLEPIDTSRMQNFETILPIYRENPVFRGEDGELYGVPFTFSFQSPLYNADRVEPLETFAEFVDNPALKGRYAIPDGFGNFTWIAQVLGLGNPDPTYLTRDELAQCVEYAKQVVANARTLWASLGDSLQLMISGEVDYTTEGTFDQVAEAQAQGVNIQTFFAQEGSQTYVDAYCIPRETENYDVSLAWIDHMLTPEAQAEVAVVYGGAAVNLDAVPLMAQELQDRYDYDDLESLLERAPAHPPTPVESDEFATYAEWTEAWNEVK
jgi:spermidine/putrescine transport system substrate-binding protein